MARRRICRAPRRRRGRGQRTAARRRSRRSRAVTPCRPRASTATRRHAGGARAPQPPSRE
eukprot:6102501-Prymnesium_polylepis.1